MYPVALCFRLDFLPMIPIFHFHSTCSVQTAWHCRQSFLYILLRIQFESEPRFKTLFFFFFYVWKKAFEILGNSHNQIQFCDHHVQLKVNFGYLQQLHLFLLWNFKVGFLIHFHKRKAKTILAHPADSAKNNNINTHMVNRFSNLEKALNEGLFTEPLFISTTDSSLF